MARIISGGFKTGGSKSLQMNNRIVEEIPLNKQESWPEYLKRNASQVGAGLYGKARSGLGLGNVAKAYAEESNSPEWVKTGLRYGLPSPQEAREEYGNVQNKLSALEQKGSFGNLLQGIMGQAGIPEDSSAQQFARNITPEVKPASYYSQSKPEDYWPQQLAQGGITAGIAAATGGASAILPALGVHGAVIGASKGGEKAGEYLGEQVGYPETGREAGALLGAIGGAKYIPKAVNYIHNRPSKRLVPEVKKMEESFINKANEDIRNYDLDIHKLKESRSPLYNEAKKIENLKPFNANNTESILKPKIELARSNSRRGIPINDSAIIDQMLSGLESEILRGKFTTDNAKTYRRAFNKSPHSQILAPVTEELGKLVLENNTPEHNALWQPAEAQHAQLKGLEDSRTSFVNGKKNEVRIAKSKLDTFNDLVKDPKTSKWTLGGISYLLGKGPYGAAAEAIGAGHRLFTKESGIAARILETHPEIHAKWMQLADILPEMSKERASHAITTLGYELQDIAEQEDIFSKKNKNKGGKRIISGGFK